MEGHLIDKVYDFFQHIIHFSDLKEYTHHSKNVDQKRICPVTGLDISMQPKNSKFLSPLGVKWYYENNKKLYDKILASRLTENIKDKELKVQFREIAHGIRNSVSNPKNNARRAIQKLLSEKDILFNNFQLIDKHKLQEAGISKNSD